MVSEKEAIGLLKKYSIDEERFDRVLQHSKAVRKAALEIAKKIKNVDLEFIKTASLLHDIGRFQCPPGELTIKHGIVGAEILRKEGLEKYALVAERHLGIGIRKEDIIEQKLELPLKDYVPKSKEEKIIVYADNLVSGSEIKDINYVIERFRKELGGKYAERIKKFHEEIMKLKK